MEKSIVGMRVLLIIYVGYDALSWQAKDGTVDTGLEFTIDVKVNVYAKVHNSKGKASYVKRKRILCVCIAK